MTENDKIDEANFRIGCFVFVTSVSSTLQQLVNGRADMATKGVVFSMRENMRMSVVHTHCLNSESLYCILFHYGILPLNNLCQFLSKYITHRS
jgi:hypothetical protein